MPQPVKLSDTLIDSAREAADQAHRSLAAQVEHWATLGRAVDASITAGQAAALKYAVREPTPSYASGQRDLGTELAQALARALSPDGQRAFRNELAMTGAPAKARSVRVAGQRTRGA